MAAIPGRSPRGDPAAIPAGGTTADDGPRARRPEVSPAENEASEAGQVMNFAELSDQELIRWWCAQEPTDEGTSVLQDELAEEIERRGLDV
jgi:hypothetical protein